MSDVARRTATDSFWWPATVTPWVRGLAVASLLTNSLLILTGGLVRLTGSGLGCPTWPRCTADSWTSTQEMGVDRKSTRLNSSHSGESRMPSSA